MHIVKVIARTWNRSGPRQLAVYLPALLLTSAGLAFAMSTPMWLWLVLGALVCAQSVALGIVWARRDIARGDRAD